MTPSCLCTRALKEGTTAAQACANFEDIHMPCRRDRLVEVQSGQPDTDRTPDACTTHTCSSSTAASIKKTSFNRRYKLGQPHGRLSAMYATGQKNPCAEGRRTPWFRGPSVTFSQLVFWLKGLFLFCLLHMSKAYNAGTPYRNEYAFAAIDAITEGVVAWGDSNYGGDAPSGVTGPAVGIYSTWKSFALLKTDGTVVSWGNSSWASQRSEHRYHTE